MRTKLFLAFLAVLMTALVSNFAFKRLIIRDFEDYALGMREDRLYWVMAALEGSRREGRWDVVALRHYLHWAALIGFEVEVADVAGGPVMATEEALEGISPTMRRRLEAIVDLESGGEDYDLYPLYSGGEEIGELRVRPLRMRGHLAEKEAVFLKRGQDFLVITLLIAGGGAFLLSLVFSVFLTGPLRRLRRAASRVAKGDLAVRVPDAAHDEIGSLGRAFNRMVEALERDEALRKRLTLNVAHELRTPLAVARARVEAMADGVIPCSNAELENVAAEIRRLTALIEGIEDMARAEASFFKPAEYEDVELGEFLVGIAGGMQALARQKGIALEARQGGPFTVSTDLEKLERIVRNIVSNAIRHTDQGRVDLNYGSAPDGRGFFVEVRDTGPGISEEDLQHIFKRFYRGGRGGQGGGGIGLGLAIARELAGIMGGEISVESRPGEGAAFRVTLPSGPPA